MEPSLNRRFHTDILIAVPNIHSQVNISFELGPITDPLNQFDEDLTFIPKITLSPKTRTSKDLGVALTPAQLHKKAGTTQGHVP